MDTAIQCPDLVSKCGPTSGFRSSLGSYFLYRDVIAATKTDLQSHSIQAAPTIQPAVLLVVQQGLFTCSLAIVKVTTSG